MSRRRAIHIIENAEYVTIGELVRLTGSRYSTLKYYTEEGMLPYEQAEENLTRRYNRIDAVKRISYIKKLKSNGLSIPEIKKSLLQRNDKSTQTTKKSLLNAK